MLATNAATPAWPRVQLTLSGCCERGSDPGAGETTPTGLRLKAQGWPAPGLPWEHAPERQPQRGCGSKPRVGPPRAYPGNTRQRDNPNGVVAQSPGLARPGPTLGTPARET